MKKLPRPKYKVELIEQNNKHIYKVTKGKGESILLPGTTGILSIIGGGKTRALMQWRLRVGLEAIKNELQSRLGTSQEVTITVDDRYIDSLMKKANAYPKTVTDAALDFGSKLHQAIDDVIQGKEPVVDEEIKAAYKQFLQWFYDSGYSFIASEVCVASVKHGYGGSFDAVAYNNKTKKLALIDWKTSRAIYNEYGLQVAGAYWNAFIETYGIEAQECLVVQFPKEPWKPYAMKRAPDPKKCFDGFLAAKNLQDIIEGEILEEVKL